MTEKIDFFARNQAWAENVKQEHPDFFQKLATGQNPDYFWISCCDSRVPVNDMFDLLPGELFVYRNIANQAAESDMGFLSALQYAVEVLKVTNIVVVGHYECGGVKAAMHDRGCSMVEHWIQDIAVLIDELQITENEALTDQEKLDLACEQNVLRQVHKLQNNPIVTQALNRGQELTIHGWIYDLRDGFLKQIPNTSV